MKSTFETLEDTAGKHLVKLSLTIEEAEFDRDIDKAFRTLANEVRLPGFRQGKVPRKVLEARIGLGPAREQALRDAIPAYLSAAVREHDIDLIATPEVEITGSIGCEWGSKRGGLSSCRASLSVKAQERGSGKILATDRQTSIGLDVGKHASAKAAFLEVTDQIAARLVPCLSK